MKEGGRYMKKKELMMGLIMAGLISFAVGVLVAILIPIISPEATKAQPVTIRYVSNILMSVITSEIVAFIVPLGKMGRNLAAKAGVTPPSIKFNLINAIPFSIGNTLIVSLVCSFFGVLIGRSHIPPEVLSEMKPFPVMWLGSWSALLLPTLVVSYILAVILAPLVANAVGLGRPQGPRGPEGPENRPVEE